MGSCCSGTFHSYNPHEVDLTHFEMMKVVGRGGFGKVNVVCKLDTRELLAMKRIDKASVVAKQSHIDMIWVERNIMAKVTSPFLCHLIYAFQSPTELFLVMPFMQGGDLRYHLKERAGAMTEPVCRYYCAEIILALEALHGANILYRDMKPDNILLDGEGHLRLSDFGISVELTVANNMRTRGRAGTRGYQAPELFDNQTYGFSCDIFSFGVTIYELLHGTRPFNSKKMNQQVASADRFPPVRYKTRLTPEAKSLLQGMLAIDPNRRLGCGPGGLNEVKLHPWFTGMDWVAMAKKEIEPPIKPDTTKANCSSDFDLEEQLSEEPPRLITKEQQRHFEGFEYHTRIGPGGRILPDLPPPPRYAGITPANPQPPPTTLSTDGAAASSPSGRLTPSMNNYLIDSRLEKASPRSLSFTRTRSGFDTGPSSRVQSPAPALLSPSSANKDGALGSGAPSPVPTSPGGAEGKGRSMRRAPLSSASHSNTGGGPNSNNGLPAGGSASGSAPHSPMHPSGLRMSSGPLPAVLLSAASGTVVGTPTSAATGPGNPSPPMPAHSLLHAGATSPHGSSSTLLGAGVRSPSLSLSPRARMRTSSQLPPSLSNAHLPLPGPPTANSSSTIIGASTSLNVTTAAALMQHTSGSPPASTRNTSRHMGATNETSPPEHLRHMTSTGALVASSGAAALHSHGTLSATNTMITEAHPFGAPEVNDTASGIPSPSLASSIPPASPMANDTPSLGPSAATAGSGSTNGNDMPDLMSKPVPSIAPAIVTSPSYSDSPLSGPSTTTGTGVLLNSSAPPTSTKRQSSHLVSFIPRAINTSLTSITTNNDSSPGSARMYQQSSHATVYMNSNGLVNLNPEGMPASAASSPRTVVRQSTTPRTARTIAATTTTAAGMVDSNNPTPAIVIATDNNAHNSNSNNMTSPTTTTGQILSNGHDNTAASVIVPTNNNTAVPTA